MEHKTLSVLRRESWPALATRLDEAARDSAAPHTREVLLRPLQLLELMAADAPGALGDDVLAAERLRMLFHLAAPFHAIVDEARSLDDGARGQDDASYEPGVLDHGALALVGLAALRVASPGNERTFVRTVHGLALAAAPTEVLGRLVPRVPNGHALSVILDTLYLLDNVGARLHAPLLRPFASDPSERARWRCLARLLEKDLPGAVDTALGQVHYAGRLSPWDGGSANGIEEVGPRHAAPGEEVTVIGRFEGLGRGPELPEGVHAVFASPEGAPFPARVISFKPGKPGNLKLEVPALAQPGWIGFSHDPEIAAANAFRAALRDLLPRALAAHGCVRSDEVRGDVIGPIGMPDPHRPGKLLAVPPRKPGNRWLGPKRAEPAAPIATEPFAASSSLRPRIVSMKAAQAGRERPLWTGVSLDVEVAVDPPLAEVEMSLLVDPSPAGAEPLSPLPRQPGERFNFAVPAPEDGMVLTALMRWGDGTAARRTLGPLRVAPSRPVQVVVVRPQVVESPGENEQPVELGRILKLIGALQGLCIEPVELPWVDDALAVLTTPVASADDARIPELLESLSGRAMLTPHLEHAVWLLLVPMLSLERESDTVARAARFLLSNETSSPAAAADPGRPSLSSAELYQRAVASGRGFCKWLPAVAAHAVALADPLGLFKLFAELFPPSARMPQRSPPTPRLRLLGTLDGSVATLTSVHEENRGVGPGAPFDSGIVAVALDAGGRALLQSKVTCLRQTRPAQLAVLVPVSDLVAAVELRRGHAIVERVDRTTGKPTIESARLTAPVLSPAQSLQWRFRHTANARPALTLGLTVGRLTTEVDEFDACDRRPPLHLTRYASAAEVSLLASDGWNLALRVVDDPEGEHAVIWNPTPVQIRRLADGRFFADVPHKWSAHWSLDGKHAHEGRTFSPPPGVAGMLRLEARERKETPPLIDERPVEDA